MVPRVVPKCISLESTYSELSNALSNVFISQKLTEIQLFKVRYNYPLRVNFLTSVSKSKNGAWWDVYFLMLIFRLFFILADKISRFAKSWLPIQNLNLVARSEIPYQNWRYDFVTFSHNFCQNAWTSSLCTHPNNGVFPISTVVMWTRNA